MKQLLPAVVAGLGIAAGVLSPSAFDVGKAGKRFLPDSQTELIRRGDLQAPSTHRPVVASHSDSNTELVELALNCPIPELWRQV